MKNIFIKGSLLVIIILLSCNLFFYLFRIPDLKKKITEEKNNYTELYKTNEECESGYIEINEKNKKLESTIEEQKTTIQKKDNTIAEKDKTIASKNAEIKKLNQEIADLKK